jgi:microcystin-dependent protein
MGDQYLGEIRMVAFNFVPRDWALCNGATLQISQNQALFAVLGIQFGGDDVQPFNLPDLQGRFPACQGNGTGIPNLTVGEMGGEVSVTLGATNLPAHAHEVRPPVSNVAGSVDSPVGAYPAVSSASTSATPTTTHVTVTPNSYAPAAVAGMQGASYPTAPTGTSTPLSVVPPYTVVNFMIATAGIFPTRN